MPYKMVKSDWSPEQWDSYLERQIALSIGMYFSGAGSAEFQKKYTLQGFIVTNLKEMTDMNALRHLAGVKILKVKTLVIKVPKEKKRGKKLHSIGL